MINRIPTLVAFDCFGTVFDASSIPPHLIAAYSEHVRRDDFSPFTFPPEWWAIPAHSDSSSGVDAIRRMGIKSVALSNGPPSLIGHLAASSGVSFDQIIDLSAHRVYKPHREAYAVVESETGIPPADCLMVTANPTFGDVEGALAIGMQAIVIRHGFPETIIDLAVMLLDLVKVDRGYI